MYPWARDTSPRSPPETPALRIEGIGEGGDRAWLGHSVARMSFSDWTYISHDQGMGTEKRNLQCFLILATTSGALQVYCIMYDTEMGFSSTSLDLPFSLQDEGMMVSMVSSMEWSPRTPGPIEPGDVLVCAIAKGPFLIGLTLDPLTREGGGVKGIAIERLPQSMMVMGMGWSRGFDEQLRIVTQDGQVFLRKLTQKRADLDGWIWGPNLQDPFPQSLSSTLRELKRRERGDPNEDEEEKEVVVVEDEKEETIHFHGLSTYPSPWGGVVSVIFWKEDSGALTYRTELKTFSEVVTLGTLPPEEKAQELGMSWWRRGRITPGLQDALWSVGSIKSFQEVRWIPHVLHTVYEEKRDCPEVLKRINQAQYYISVELTVSTFP